MDGKTIFKLAVQKLPEVVGEALKIADLATSSVTATPPRPAFRLHLMKPLKWELSVMAARSCSWALEPA
jgi:hypothetical protein